MYTNNTNKGILKHLKNAPTYDLETPEGKALIDLADNVEYLIRTLVEIRGISNGISTPEISDAVELCERCLVKHNIP